MYRFGMSDTYAALIDLWPEPADLAADLGTTAGHVRVMRTRNRVPDNFWLRMVEGATARGIPGVTLERLARLADGRGHAPSGPAEDGEAA